MKPMSANERMQALIRKHTRPEPPTAAERAQVDRRMADSRDAVEQLIGVYRARHRGSEPRYDALGAVVLIAKSVAPSSDHLAMMLAAAVELLAEQAKETDGG